MIATQMEATSCRAYNVSKSRRLGLRITVADCAGEPFKLMKVILDGLAQNPEAAFWLTNIEHSPQIVRIFPIDFAYLDSDLKVLQAVELPPGIPLPKFHPQAGSALILPLGSLASNKTAEGDELIIGTDEELNELLRDPAAARADAGVTEGAELTAGADVGEATVEIPSQVAPALEQNPFFAPQTTVPIQPPNLGPGSGFTVAIASGWQVATATTASVALEAVEPSTDEVADRSSTEELVSEQEKADESREEVVLPHSASCAEVESSEAPLRPEVNPPTIDLTQIAVLERALVESVPQEAISSEPAMAAPDAKPHRSTEELIARSKAAAETAYVKVISPSTAPSAKAKKKSASQKEKKEHIGNKVVRWLALDAPLPERREIIRLVLQGLQVYEAKGNHSKRYQVRDICPPGLYIRSDEPWQEGDVLSLVLVKEGATEKDHEHRVSIQARVVRRDEEGVGVAFVFPEGTEFQPWQRAKTKRSDESEADFILRELRLARALGFLRRLCPWAANEVNHALLERLSNKRVTSAVEIALKAEEILLNRGHVAQPFVASDVVVRIIEGGSWIDEDWIRRMWAGLLVSSCSADGQDRTNLSFIDLLARLTPIHLRILSFVCHRGVEALAAGESEAALDLYSTAAELMEAADSHSFPRIQQTIGQLASVGLLAETARPSYVEMSDRSKTRTTPTALGLRMFARCNGHQS